MGTRDSDGIRWHYTTGSRFKQILESGVIRPATKFVPAGERPVVWFSTEPVWEPTANKMRQNRDGSFISQDMTQTAEGCEGLVRIGVLPQTAPHDWRAFKQLSGISAKMAEGLYNVAKLQNARPGHWYVTFEEVPKSAWVSIETWDGVNPAGWMPYETGKDG